MSTPKSPVGYIINHRGGTKGSQGIGYDYVLGAEGLSVQARSDTLRARVPIARATVRGLARANRSVKLRNGPLPAELIEAGIAIMKADPHNECMFAIRFDGDRYMLAIPEQVGSASSVVYRPPADAVAEFHSHCSMRAFFSATDDADEQAFRIYGVCGRLDKPVPELRMRIGIYGHFDQLSADEVFDRRPAGVTVREPGDPMPRREDTLITCTH